MEPVGVVSLLPVLAKTCLQGYNIFENIEGLGSSSKSILHDLETERLRLKHWVEARGLGDPITTNIATNQLLDPEDDRYRYAIGTLAQICGLFGNIQALHEKYGIKVDVANECTSTQ